MKKLLVPAIALFFLLSGCSTTYHYNIGQSTGAFFRLNKSNKNHLRLIKDSSEWTIYQTDGSTPLFFYFRNNNLIQVDRGERSADIVIQNR